MSPRSHGFLRGLSSLGFREGDTSARPEIAGLDGILRGWLAAGWSDAAIESAGVPLFEGLYG